MTNLSDAQAALVAAQKAETDAQTAVNDATGDIAAAQASVAAVTSALTDAGDVLADAQVELTAANVALSDAKAVVVAAQAVVTDLSGTPIPPPPTTEAPGTFTGTPNYLTSKPSSTIDPNSAAMANAINGNIGLWNGGTVYEVPVGWTGTRVTPTVTDATAWGPVGLRDVTIPLTGEIVSNTSDEHLSVIDWTTGLVYDMWETVVTATSITCGYGGVYSIAGNGVTPNPEKDPEKGTGSSLPSMFGMLRVKDIVAGVCNHALAFSSEYTSKTFRLPASSSDGSGTAASSIPEGARFSIKGNAVFPSGLNSGTTIVLKALQNYGGYCIDSGGAGMAVLFEQWTPAAGGTVDPFLAAFGDTSESDWFNLSAIPASWWNANLQVTAS